MSPICTERDNATMSNSEPSPGGSQGQAPDARADYPSPETGDQPVSQPPRTDPPKSDLAVDNDGVPPPDLWPDLATNEPDLVVASRQRRRRARMLVTACLAVVAIGSAIGTVLATSGGTSGRLPVGPATTVVLTAASRASQSSGVNVSVSGSFTAPSTGPFTITGSGQANWHAQTLQLNMTFHGKSAALNGMQETGLYVGGDMYLWSPGFARYFPGKQWIKIPFAKASGTQSLGGNPGAELEMLAHHGNTVRATGAATVNGVLAEGYNVKLNASALRRELATAHWSASFKQQVTQGLRMMHGLSFKVWVSGKQLVQMTVHMQMAIAGTPMTATFTYGFQYTESSVNITAPRSGVVSYSSFEQLAQSQS